MTQHEYIQILFDDLGFSITQRKDWLEIRYGRRFTDELSAKSLHRIIEELKMRKENRSADSSPST